MIANMGERFEIKQNWNYYVHTPRTNHKHGFCRLVLMIKSHNEGEKARKKKIDQDAFCSLGYATCTTSPKATVTTMERAPRGGGHIYV